MGNCKFQIDRLSDLPDKVRLMFEAVTEMIAEHADIASLKVSDITARAGIGKGTAYEYFSSKEELITMALVYDYSLKIRELKILLDQETKFENKIYGILDWFHEKSCYHMTFVRMMQIISGSQNLYLSLKSNIPEDVLEKMHAFILENVDAIMELGCTEQVFTETDVMKRRMALASMMFQFFMTLGKKTEDSYVIMDYDKLRLYAYETLVKTLN